MYGCVDAFVRACVYVKTRQFVWIYMCMHVCVHIGNVGMLTGGHGCVGQCISFVLFQVVKYIVHWACRGGDV